jgi:membrane-associated protein
VVRDHLTTIVLVGVSAAVVPVALGGLWKVSKRMLGR